jgi:hypothetical protein
VDEFLDTEWFGCWTEVEREPHTRDPWANKGLDVLLVERGILELAAQHERMVEIERYDQLRIEHVADSIERCGLQQALLLQVDLQGRVALKDGHHRLAATRRWSHFDLLPVTLEIVESLKVNRPARLAPMLHELVAGARRAGPSHERRL